MPYNEYLVDRVRYTLKENKVVLAEKKMFGGLCWFVDDKLLTGVFREELMVRIDPEDEREYLAKYDCKRMDESGSMKGFLMITPEGIDMDDDLDLWIKRCLEFNPLAKASKKKR